MLQRKFWLLAVAGLVLALGACSSRTVVESDLGIEDAPDWVNEGSQALNDENGRYIHGIGAVEKMPSQSLQVATADDRARAEVGRVLSSYLNAVSQDYSAAAGSGAEQYSEQAVSRQIDNVTRLNMSGVRIIAHWKDPNNGTVYSLAELDMRRVKDVVAKVDMMNSDFRDYFQTNSDSIFDRFSKENP